MARIWTLSTFLGKNKASKMQGRKEERDVAESFKVKVLQKREARDKEDFKDGKTSLRVEITL